MDGNRKDFSDGRVLALYDYNDTHKLLKIVDKNGLITENLYENDLLIELAKLIGYRCSR